MHACIDLGSNSFHLLIGEWDKGRIQIIERLSEKVQLGENVGTTGSISEEAFQRGMDCLQRFKLLMKQYPLQKYWALGTNTFRIADNAQEFIDAAENLGISISTISGIQEAVLIYAGVITSLPETDAHRLVFDIGGGSTEIIIGSGQDRTLTESLPVGSVAWRDRFFAAENPDQAALERQMGQGALAAREIFESIAAGVARCGWSEAYASSGTVKMLSYVCTEHGYGRGQIQLDGLHALKPAMAAAIARGEDFPGVKERRRDLLLPGWCILVALMEAYGVQRIDFSATALREGMLDFMVKNEKTMQALEQGDLPDVNYAKR